MGAPTSATTSGGGRSVVFYTMSEDHATIGATPVLTLDRIIKSSVKRNTDNGGHDADFTQDQDNEALWTFIETYAAVVAASAGGDDTEYEDAYTETAAAASGLPNLLVVIAGGVSNKALDTNRKGTAIVGICKTDSGSFDQESKKKTNVTLGVECVEALTTITITAAMLPPGLYSGTATDVVIPKGKRSKVFFREKAA